MRKPERLGTIWTATARLYDVHGNLVGRCMDTPNAVAKAMMEHPEIIKAYTLLGVIWREDYQGRMASWNVAVSQFQPA